MKTLLHFLLFFTFLQQAAATKNKATGTEKNSKPKGSATLQRNSQTIIFNDNMNGANDTASLHQRGYVTRYNGGGPQEAPTWFQGDWLQFEAYNGPDSGYVAADFNVVAGNNQIDSWLMLPAMSINTGDTLSFFSRSKFESTYRDSIKVMYSASGNTNVNSPDWVELGFFKTDTTGIWKRNAFTATSQGSNARFAIRYFLTSGGPSGLASEYIGVDQITVSTGIVGREEELANSLIRIFPNPASSNITIYTPGDSGDLKIYNALGQEVHQQKLNSKEQKVNIETLPSGVYIVTIVSEEGVSVKRFVKR